VQVKISASTAHKFSNFWIFKLHHTTINVRGKECDEYYQYDLPTGFLEHGVERVNFEKAVSIIVDDIVMNFINQKDAFDPRQNSAEHEYLIYRPKSDADEAEFIAKVAALDGMIFDI